MDTQLYMIDRENIEVNNLPVNRNRHRSSWEDLLECTTSRPTIQHSELSSVVGYGDNNFRRISSAHPRRGSMVDWNALEFLDRTSYLWKDAYSASNYLFDIDEQDNGAENTTMISEESMLWIVSME